MRARVICANSGAPLLQVLLDLRHPDGFVGETDREILLTLVHEMAHVWQQVFGKPRRRGYHNREWGAEMKRIGLYPSSTAMPRGKATSERMRHYIVDDGLFDKAYSRLFKRGFKLDGSPPKFVVVEAASRLTV